MNAKGQVAVVTGATSGIGQAVTLTLSNLGMRMALVGRDPERLKSVMEEARAHSQQVVGYEADLSCDEDIKRVVSGVRNDFAAVDVLVHCAGLFRMGAIEHAQIADLDLLYRVNVRAPYALTQALLPMVRARRGQIVFVNSSAGLTARAGVAAYAATKHALKAIADALRAEVNAAGVRVITVYPGRTATPAQERIHSQEGKPYHPEKLLQPGDVARTIVHALAMPQTAEVTDINIRPMQKA